MSRDQVIGLLVIFPLFCAYAEELVLKAVKGVAFDSRDHLFVADSGNHRVLEFDEVLRLVRQFGSGKAGDAEGQLRGPMDVAVDEQRERVVVSDGYNHRIVIFSSTGKFLRSFGKKGKKRGDLGFPTKVTLDEHGHIIVTERDNHRLQVFDASGKSLHVLENRTGPRSEADIDMMFEYGRSRKKNVKRESFAGDWKRTDVGQFNEPGGVFYDRGLKRLFVANGWNCRIEILDYDSASGRIARRDAETGIAWGFWITRGCAGTADGELLGIQTAWGTVRKFKHRDGLNVNVKPYVDIHPRAYGRVAEVHDIAVAPKSGAVALADTRNSRVVIYDKDFTVPEAPRVDSITSEGATIRYDTNVPATTKVMLRESPYPLRTPEKFVNGGFGKTRVVSRGAGQTTRHVLKLDSLKPASRYYYRLHMPGLRTIPGDGWSREYTINTLAGPGKTSFIRIPVLVLLLTNVIGADNLDGKAPQIASMSAEDIERYYLNRFREAQRFYWLNSSMRYWVDFDLRVDDTTYRKGAMPKAPPLWYLDLPEMNHGKSIDKLKKSDGGEKLFYGRVICEAVRRWNPQTKSWDFQGSGGGTHGIDNWPNPASTQFLGGSDVAWLFCHEFKHQVESQYKISGLSREDDRMWFCHFSPKYDDPKTEKIEWEWDTAGDHGEHWDGIAWQLRHLTRDQYMRNGFGELLSAADRDGDGIPDNAPRLPLDERRLGTSSTRLDTDGDGVGDVQELMASTWVTAMLAATRKRVSVPYIRPDPTKTDSDGDGLADGQDPYPIYACKPEIPFATVNIDGDLSDWKTHQEIAFNHHDLGPAREAVNIKVRASWDTKWLFYSLETRSPHRGISLVTDNDANGFYYGNDNIYLETNADGTLKNVRMHLCSRNRWPHFDNKHEVLKKEDIRFASKQNGERQTIEIAFPMWKEIGLDPKPAEKVGLMVYIRLPSGAQVSVFEPYSIFDSELTR